MNNILISGAGIAGLSMARQLKKHGISYTIIEKNTNWDIPGMGIALPANAVRALRFMELSKAVDTMHQVTDIIYAQSNGKILSKASLLDSSLNKDKFIALERAALLNVLRQNLESDIYFNTTITMLQQTETGIDITCSDPKLNGHYQGIIGADGIYSSVRDLGFEKRNLLDLGITAWRWMCDYPTTHLQPTYMLGKGEAFLAYPTGPNRVYCYAHKNDAIGQYHHSEKSLEHLYALFAHYKGIAELLLKRLPENQHIHVGRLRSTPKTIFSQNHIALIGDASHACSPMLQQGAALAFEDAIILSELLVKFPVMEAFNRYATQRSQRVNWIVKTSDEGIKASLKVNSVFTALARNLLIRYKGPLNVLGWKHLLSNCPIDDLTHTHK